MTVNAFKSQAIGAQTSNPVPLDVPLSAAASLHTSTTSSLDADRCVRCKLPLNGQLDLCGHFKRCRENQEMVTNGWMPTRSRCENGGRCPLKFEEHYLGYIH